MFLNHFDVYIDVKNNFLKIKKILFSYIFKQKHFKPNHYYKHPNLVTFNYRPLNFQESLNHSFMQVHTLPNNPLGK
jgi:hypothetical protein